MAVTDSVSLTVRRTTTQHIAWFKPRRMILPLLSAFAFGFGAIASKRSEDGGERAGVRANVNGLSIENTDGPITFVP